MLECMSQGCVETITAHRKLSWHLGLVYRKSLVRRFSPNSGLASPGLPPLGSCLEKKQADTDLLFNRNYRPLAWMCQRVTAAGIEWEFFIGCSFPLSTPSLGWLHFCVRVTELFPLKWRQLSKGRPSLVPTVRMRWLLGNSTQTAKVWKMLLSPEALTLETGWTTAWLWNFSNPLNFVVVIVSGSKEP